MTEIPLVDEIKNITVEVTIEFGHATKEVLVEQIEGAKTEDSTSHADDLAGTWRIQCGTDAPVNLSLTNRQITDPDVDARRATTKTAIKDLMEKSRSEREIIVNNSL